MGTLALSIALGVIVVAAVLLLFVRRSLAHGDRRDFGSSDGGGAIVASDSGSSHAGDSCGSGAGGDCGGGDGGGGGGGD